MDVKEILKRRRIEKQLTLEDVGRLVGVSAATISRWESGDIANMKRDKIVKLAKALDISPAVVMGWDDLEKELKPTKEEIKIIHENSYENLVISEMKKMNQRGKVKLLDTARDMTCNPLYNNNYKLEVDAAHARTDIDIPENIDTSDNDIMDDEKF